MNENSSFQIWFYKKFRFTIIAVFSLVSFSVFSQNSIGNLFQESSLWIRSEINSNQVSSNPSSTMGQYLPLDLDSVKTQLEVSFTPSNDFTGFFVITPLFDSVKGIDFLQLGSNYITDEGVRYGRRGVQVDFKRGEPTIIAMRPKTKTFASERIQRDYFYGDSLFEITEIILFDQVLNSDDVRKIETYLALKYSINITNNTTPVYQNYFNLNNGFYWNHQTDGLYREYVIGLGKDSVTSFDQSQTFTNEIGYFGLSLDSMYALGTLNPTWMDNGSLALFSKNPKKNAGKKCKVINTPSLLTNWKIRLTDWNSPAQNFVFEVKVDTYSEIDSLKVTDGSSELLLAITKKDSMERIVIPIDFFQNEVDYFIKPLDKDVDCEDEITLDADSLGLSLATDDPSSLNSLMVTNLSSGTTLDIPIQENLTTIRNLTNGQNQIDLYTQNGDLAYHEIVWVNGSSEETSIDQLSVSQIISLPPSAKRNEYLNKFNLNGLLAYPNPGKINHPVRFELINPIEGQYNVRILSSSGQSVYEGNKTFSPTYYQWEYTFTIPGHYTVVFTLGDQQFIETIIAK